MEEFSFVRSDDLIVTETHWRYSCPVLSSDTHVMDDIFFFLQKNIDIKKVIQPLKPVCFYLRIRFCWDTLEYFERQELTRNSKKNKKRLQCYLISSG